MGAPTQADPVQAAGDTANSSQHAGSVELDMEKHAGPDPHANEVAQNGNESDDSDKFQGGVQRIRAITAAWSKTTLISMFCLLYLISFVDMLQNSIDATLNPYVTSYFDRHGLLAISNIMSTILGGTTPLTLAKIIDIFGRVEGFMCMLVVVLVGMIMKATCQNMEQYVAAHVLYWTGHIGMIYVVDIMCADMTSLRNRMIIFAINGTPRIASTFAGPAIGNLFYENTGFRWAFGAFTIILAACSMPAMGLMLHMFRQALKKGYITKREDQGRTWLQSLWYYFIQFDIFGIFLVTCSFSLTLMPFSLVSYAPNGWETPYIIAMVALGVFLAPCFYAWERYLAPVQFLPFKYLTEPTIIGSCLLYGVMFVSIFCWNSYFNSYLQVVHRQSMINAGYILNAMSLASSFFNPFVAWGISYTGNFKWAAYTGVPVLLLGTALLIPFRAPDTNPGVLALTQLLCGIGSGIFSICGQLAVMAPVTHQQLSAVNALYGLFGGIGAALGVAIGGALWNNIMPGQLMQRLPEDAKDQTMAIFGDIVLQMSYEDGSPEREAIVGAYSDVMRKMVITGACFIPLCLASIFVWKNINVKKLEEEQGKQTKGNVF